ncbi:MAG: hypothetical protein O3C21_09995, partial [Verrucomicrobia bacterium]|nr:hypothetical protein [Verrucomicrobiota bacterium]
MAPISLLHAQDVRTHGIAKDKDGKPTITMTVESTFSQIPLHGVAPVRVTVDDRSGVARKWRLAFESTSDDDRVLSRFEMESKKGTSTTVELLVPVATRFNTSSYSYDQDLQYTIKADKIPSETETFSEAFPADWPSILMSREVGVRNAGPLDSQVEASSSSAESFAATSELMSLPSSWRGYCGIDVVILTDSEWLRLQAEAPAVSQALLEWNRLG